MEGIKKKSSAEVKFLKQQKTDTGSPSKDSPESKVLQELNPPGPTASRIAELKALLLSVESPQRAVAWRSTKGGHPEVCAYAA